jgi:uncharacterized membrane protein
MEINRNQWFMAGLVLLLLGLQFRAVDSMVLTPEFTQFLAEGTGGRVAAADTTSPLLKPFQSLPTRKTVTPPEWLGWGLLSAGLVLTLHSLAMRRPE